MTFQVGDKVIVDNIRGNKEVGDGLNQLIGEVGTIISIPENRSVFDVNVAFHEYRTLGFKFSEIKKVVFLTEEELNKLRNDSYKLNCLEMAGVDNWEGYDMAMELYEQNN